MRDWSKSILFFCLGHFLVNFDFVCMFVAAHFLEYALEKIYI
jgi:hypothetical protein